MFRRLLFVYVVMVPFAHGRAGHGAPAQTDFHLLVSFSQFWEMKKKLNWFVFPFDERMRSFIANKKKLVRIRKKAEKKKLKRQQEKLERRKRQRQLRKQAKAKMDASRYTK